ncbi:MAG: potassium channel family protein [Acutalibacteraceae bacterium]|nr:potassium channel family protein [Acutalibacteraceae bacterium]HIR02755.1 two pore domain potassium channel family protein [Candidatus Scatovicinus merdipullorum]
MLFGLLEGDMLLIIGAVLSLMTMLLFWRVKKNSLQLAESSGKLRTLMHMPYRQVRRSIQGKLGAHKLFLLFLLLVFAVAFFLWLYMQWGAVAAAFLCLPCAALTAVFFNELVWFLAYFIRKLLAIENARMNTLFSINIVMLLFYFINLSFHSHMERAATFVLAIYNLLFCYFLTFILLLLLLKEAGEKNRTLTFKNLWKSTILIILLFLVILAGLSYTGSLHRADAFAGTAAYSYFDMFYYTCVTFATVGFGDIVPVGVFAKAVCILTIVTSIVCVTIMLSTVMSVRKNEEN